MVQRWYLSKVVFDGICQAESINNSLQIAEPKGKCRSRGCKVSDIKTKLSPFHDSCDHLAFLFYPCEILRFRGSEISATNVFRNRHD